jgi:esterase/lipase superfamily enzyme
LPGNPATDFVTLRTTDLDRDQAIKRFHQMVAATPHRRVLVFIHGFNNRFDDAVYRFAQITHDSGLDAVPVMFTWPSRGSVWAYGYDRESTNYSRDSLEDLLRFLAKDPSVGEVAILAHSMGNWLTLEALRQMAIRDKRVNPKIKTLMLAAPDVDVDVFRRQIAEIGNSGPQTTLFVSQDDRALAVSRRVWGDIPRLGAINPTTEPYKTELADEKITVIDLTKLKTDDSLNHAKFASSPEVVQLIGQRLASGQTVTDTRVGLGDRIAGVATGAAATVGSAAGLVLSAPIAVVDPNTRASLGDRINQVGAGVADTATGTGQ